MSRSNQESSKNKQESVMSTGLRNFIFRARDKVQRDVATLDPELHPEASDQLFVTPDKAFEVRIKVVASTKTEDGVDIETHVSPLMGGMSMGLSFPVDLSDFGRRGDPSVEIASSLTWDKECHSCGSKSRIIRMNIGWMEVRICSYCLLRMLPRIILDTQEMAPEPCRIEDTRDEFDIVNGTASDLLGVAATLVEGAVCVIRESEIPPGFSDYMHEAARGGPGHPGAVLDRHNQRVAASREFQRGGRSDRER